MSMNYVGSVSIVDRGDAPSQFVIDNYHRAMAKRVADETKEELEAVLKRVDSIYGNFELSSTLYDANRAANTEYVNDLMELEELIKDQVKKKKYQQQVSIFIVGYEKVCGQKLKLLQQVNEFFTDNSAKLDEQELSAMMAEREQFDLEEMSETVEHTLTTCQNLAERLGDLNHEMADYMDRVVSTKASSKSKKKLEKALSQAKSEIEGLNDKLKGLIQEIGEKEDKIQQMFKQIEFKNMETQRYKTAAEVAKKSAEESERLREEIASRDRLAADLRKQIDQLQLDVGHMQNSREQSQVRNKSQQQESQTRMDEMQKTLEQRYIDDEERRRELQRIHEIQIGELKEATRREMEQLRQQHGEETKKILEDSDYYETRKKELKEAAVQDDGEGPDGSHPDVTLQSVSETQLDYSEIPLDDDAWANVLPAQMTERFGQYRQLSLAKIRALQETIDVTIDRTVRKMDTLKAQFREHKEKWQSERTILVEQVEQADHHRAQAEQEADTALEQLEEFVNEQEKLELEEEVRRAELEEQASGLIASSGASLEEAKARLAVLEQRQQEAELQRNLLEQTDDAKAELSRLASGKISTHSDGQSGDMLQPPGQIETEDGDWFPKYKQSVLDSIGSMLDSEQTYADNQQRALRTVRRVLLTNTVIPVSQRPIPELEEKDPEGAAAIPEAAAAAVDVAFVRTVSSIDALVTPRESDQTRALYTLASHLAMETERLGVDPASFYCTLAQLYTQSLSELKADGNMLFTVPTQDQVAYDKLRKVYLSSADAAGSSSARSRASHHRSVLASLRASAEDRRSRSPAVFSIRSQKSVLSDAELDEDGDMPFPADGRAKETQEIGTSPFTPRNLSSRKGIEMYEHPIVQEYLRCYESVLNFKNNLAQFFIDKEQMSAGETLNDIEPVLFDEGSKVQPQIEEMSTSILRVLEESAHLITEALNTDREYPVSSLNMSSRGPTRVLSMRERTFEVGQSATQPAPDKSAAQNEAMAKELLTLREQCGHLEHQLADEEKRHQDEVHHNTVVMMEMQNSINSLRRELSMFAKNVQGSPEMTQPLSESPIMFTRLDSERNAKAMKKAVNERRLHTENYKNAVVTMKEYTSLPAKRFVHLVHKYVHHRQMKQIEENVSKSKSLNDDVFMILDKMESLQNMRAQKWADKMDTMGVERLRLASLLMDTLDSIERQSGIFLIKPMFSYRGNYNSDVYTGTVSNSYTGTRDMLGNLMHHPSSSAPVPTPASNTRGMGADSTFDCTSSTRPMSASNQEGGEGALVQAMSGEYIEPTWNPGMSQMMSRQPTTEDSRFLHNSYMNTPRLLELDINRMLIGQNQISSKVTPTVSSEDRLTNAAQSSVRSYVTVNRPSGNMLPKVDSAKAPDSSLKRHTSTGGAMLHTSTTPLPPINQRTASATVLTQQTGGGGLQVDVTTA